LCSRTIEQQENKKSSGRVGNAIVPIFLGGAGRLRVAQGNGGVFRTGGYGQHRHQLVKSIKFSHSVEPNSHVCSLKIFDFLTFGNASRTSEVKAASPYIL